LALGTAIDLEADRSSGHGRGQGDGVEGNARLTASTAAVIFVLLALEGLTIVRIGNLLDAHVFIGLLLIPSVLLKVASTSWRFVKYYSGDRQYRRKGPPALVLRLLGPVVVVLTLVVLISGVALVLLPTSFRQELFFVHRASFVLWLGVMTIHVLGHLGETLRLGPRDWLLRTRRQVTGASARQWVLVSSVALGLVGALAVTPYAYGWFGQF
jgi:hypothetical protein